MVFLIKEWSSCGLCRSTRVPGRPGERLGQVSRGRPGVPLGQVSGPRPVTPGPPRDAPGTPGTPPGQPLSAGPQSRGL